MKDKKLLGLIDRILQWNVKLYPFIWPIGITFFLLETFTFKGFVAKYFLVDIKIFFALVVGCGFFSYLTYSSSTKKLKENILESYKFLKNLCVLSLPITAIFSYILYTQLPEDSSFINYGGPNLIYPDRFLFIPLLTIYFIFIYYQMLKLRHKEQVVGKDISYIRSFKKRLPHMFMLVLIFWLAANSISKDRKLLVYNLKALLKNPSASYEEKMEEQIGPIFNYYQLNNQLYNK